VGLILLVAWRETAALTTAPVNLYVGATMILFALVMLWLAHRRS
jgi:hypothetical protein